AAIFPRQEACAWCWAAHVSELEGVATSEAAGARHAAVVGGVKPEAVCGQTGGDRRATNGAEAPGSVRVLIPPRRAAISRCANRSARPYREARARGRATHIQQVVDRSGRLHRPAFPTV